MKERNKCTSDSRYDYTPSTDASMGTIDVDVLQADSRELKHLPRVSTPSEHQSSAANRETETGPGASVLMSEVLDSGLLGEGVISTLRHAVAHLCSSSDLPMGCQSVPELAIFTVLPLECEALRRRTRLDMPT